MFMYTKNMRQKSFAAALLLSTSIVTLAANSPALAQYSEDQAINAFSQSQYYYCDAKLIADLWNVDIWQGKIGIGEKILMGIGENIPDALAMSRNDGNKCSWGETGFGYDDAVRIANLWDLGSVEEAKDKIEYMATNGATDQINLALGY